jgi:hypothetical protein
LTYQLYALFIEPFQALTGFPKTVFHFLLAWI